MIDVKVIDEARFAKEYAPGHAPALKAAGAFPEVVCSGDITCLRGQAKPNFIVLHAWANSAAFRTFYEGGKNMDCTKGEGMQRVESGGRGWRGPDSFCALFYIFDF